MTDLIEVKDRLLKEIKAEVIKECKEKLLLQLELRLNQVTELNPRDFLLKKSEHDFFRKIVNDLCEV